MSEEKGLPPAYVTPAKVQGERSTNKKWLWGLMFYAGAVTAGLVTVSILGAMYMETIKTGCKKDVDVHQSGASQSTKHYHLNKDDTSEDIDLDLDADKEIIRFSGPQYGNLTVAVVDFKKGVAGIYAGKTDQCFLIKGLSNRFPHAQDLDNLLSKQNTSLIGEGSEKITYIVHADFQVKDLSWIPSELYSLCWGKNVYWLQEHGGHSSREERGLRIRIRIKIGPIKIEIEIGR